MEVVTIVMSQRSDGADVATTVHDGRALVLTSRHGAVMEAARALVAAGTEDGPWQAVGPDGRVRLRGRSLHALARLTAEENDQGMRLRRWRPRAETGPAGTGGDAQDGAAGVRRPMAAAAP